MNWLKILTSSDTYVDKVKAFIELIFVHEAKKFQCEPGDLRLIIYREATGKIEIGTYSVPDNKVWRIIPDKEVQEILIK